MTQNNSTTVSVIIPTYNREKMLNRAVQSVLNQTFQDFEILICDDCSTDTTVTLAEQYADEDHRIRVFKNRINSGPGVARNLGLGHAQGRYAAFLDSDDEWLPHKLEIQLREMNQCQPKRGVSITGDIMIKNGDTQHPVVRPCEPSLLENALLTHIVKGITFSTSTLMIDRQICGDLRFNPQMRVHEDSDYIQRSLWTTELYPVVEPLTYTHYHVTNSRRVVEQLIHSSNIELQQCDRIKKHFGPKVARRYKANILITILYAAMRERRPLLAAKYTILRVSAFSLFTVKELKGLAKSFVVMLLGDFFRKAIR